MHLFPMNSIAPPLCYYGAKIRGIKQLLQYLPRGVDEIVSPFFGGGSFELAMTGRGIRVYGYDAFPPLVNFWRHLLTNPDGLIPHIKHYVNQFHKGEIDPKSDIFHELSDEERAAMFLVANNLSFNKMFFRCQAIPRFEMNAEGAPVAVSVRDGISGYRLVKYERIIGFHNPLISVELADFRDSLDKHPKMFVYADPPYPEASPGYGDSPEYHEDFPHPVLADILRTRDKWMLSYNDTETVRTLYSPSDFVYKFPKWSLSSRKIAATHNCNEVIILPKKWSIP